MSKPFVNPFAHVLPPEEAVLDVRGVLIPFTVIEAETIGAMAAKHPLVRAMLLKEEISEPTKEEVKALEMDLIGRALYPEDPTDDDLEEFEAMMDSIEMLKPIERTVMVSKIWSCSMPDTVLDQAGNAPKPGIRTGPAGKNRTNPRRR